MPVAVARKCVIVDVTIRHDDLVGRLADEELPTTATVVRLSGVVDRFQLDEVTASGTHRQRRRDPALRLSRTHRRQHFLELGSELAASEAVQQEVDGVVDVH